MQPARIATSFAGRGNLVDVWDGVRPRHVKLKLCGGEGGGGRVKMKRGCTSVQAATGHEDDPGVGALQHGLQQPGEGEGTQRVGGEAQLQPIRVGFSAIEALHTAPRPGCSHPQQHLQC